MARGITFTGTTPSATASGGVVSLNISGLPNAFNVTKLKVQPSTGSGPSTAELYSTAGGGNLRGKWKSVSGNIYDPMDNSSGTPAEGPAAHIVSVYEDEDGAGALHVKVTNLDTVNKTYTVSGTYEEVWTFDSSRVATARKAELLDGYLYFGGRTSAHTLIKRSGIQMHFLLGDESGWAVAWTHSVVSVSNVIYFGGSGPSDARIVKYTYAGNPYFALESGDGGSNITLNLATVNATSGKYYFGDPATTPVLQASGNQLLVSTLADLSGYCNVYASYFIAMGGGVCLGGVTSGDVRIRKQGAIAICRTGDDVGDAGFSAAFYDTGGGLFFGHTASQACLVPWGTPPGSMAVRLGDLSDHGDLSCRNIYAANLIGQTYTPTAGNVANVSVVSVGVAQYSRIGNVVSVSGQITIDPTSNATTTIVAISLPVSTNFTAHTQAGGVLSFGRSGSSSWLIFADPGNNRVLAQVDTVEWVDSRTGYYHFQYLVQ